MNDRQLSTTVLDRLDHIRDTDPASVTALDVYQDVTMHLETNDPALFRRIDTALVHVFAALMSAAWRDGYNVGQNPGLLVYAQQQAPAVSMPFEWVTVAEGVEIAQTVDQVVDDLLNGGAA